MAQLSHWPYLHFQIHGTFSPQHGLQSIKTLLRNAPFNTGPGSKGLTDLKTSLMKYLHCAVRHILLLSLRVIEKGTVASLCITLILCLFCTPPISDTAEWRTFTYIQHGRMYRREKLHRLPVREPSLSGSLRYSRRWTVLQPWWRQGYGRSGTGRTGLFYSPFTMYRVGHDAHISDESWCDTQSMHSMWPSVWIPSDCL